MWNDLIEFINAHQRFQISTHIHPDGDAIGAQLALGLLLEELGKSALLINQDPVPQVCSFLNSDGRVLAYQPERDDAALAACDAAFVVDVGTLERTGRVGDVVRDRKLPVACIDHHMTNTAFAAVNVVDPDAPSTSSLVLDLIRRMGRTPSPRMAEALFVGLLTDTGWLRFANATPGAFRDAGDLVAAGAYPPRIYELVYENMTWSHSRLLARTLATLKSDSDGRIAYVTITRAMFEETGAADEEVEGFVDELRTLGGVEIILMFRDRLEGGTRVSLRAKHDLDVASIAKQFGGGGHRRAAGIILDQPLDVIIPPILAAARELLKS